MLNQIEITTNGECLVIKSHISKEIFNDVNSEKLRIINVFGFCLDENDLNVITELVQAVNQYPEQLMQSIAKSQSWVDYNTLGGIVNSSKLNESHFQKSPQ